MDNDSSSVKLKNNSILPEIQDGHLCANEKPIYLKSDAETVWSQKHFESAKSAVSPKEDNCSMSNLKKEQQLMFKQGNVSNFCGAFSSFRNSKMMMNGFLRNYPFQNQNYTEMQLQELVKNQFDISKKMIDANYHSETVKSASSDQTVSLVKKEDFPVELLLPETFSSDCRKFSNSVDIRKTEPFSQPLDIAVTTTLKTQQSATSEVQDKMETPVLDNQEEDKTKQIKNDTLQSIGPCKQPMVVETSAFSPNKLNNHLTSNGQDTAACSKGNDSISKAYSISTELDQQQEILGNGAFNFPHHMHTDANTLHTQHPFLFYKLQNAASEDISLFTRAAVTCSTTACTHHSSVSTSRHCSDVPTGNTKIDVSAESPAPQKDKVEADQETFSDSTSSNRNAASGSLWSKNKPYDLSNQAGDAIDTVSYDQARENWLKTASQQDLLMLLFLTNHPMLSLPHLANMASLTKKQVEIPSNSIESSSYTLPSAMMMLQQQRMSKRPQTPPNEYLDSSRIDEAFSDDEQVEIVSPKPKNTQDQILSYHVSESNSRNGSNISDEQLHLMHEKLKTTSQKAIQSNANEERYHENSSIKSSLVNGNHNFAVAV